jgi:uncharacterized membrane protein (DUF106 family)
MTWLPRSPGSTLVLWLNQETILDFILPFLPPCGPYLTLLATGSLEPSLLVFSTHFIIKEKRKKEKKQLKENSNKQSKAKQRQRARSLERGKTRSP